MPKKADNSMFFSIDISNLLVLVATSLVFLGIPLVLGLAMGFYTIDRFQEAEKDSYRNHYKSRLHRIVLEKDSFASTDRDLIRFLKELRYSWATAATLGDVSGRIIKKFAGSRLYIFQSGKLYLAFGNAGDRDLFQEVFSYFWKIRHDIHFQNKGDLKESVDALLNSYFGKKFSVAFLQKMNGEFFEVNFRGKAGLMFFEFRQDGLGLAICLEGLSPETIPLFRAGKQNFTKYRSFLGKAIPGIGFWEPPSGISSETMETVYSLATTRNGVFSRKHKENEWFFSRDRWGNVLSYTAPVFYPNKLFTILRGILVFTGLLFLISGVKLIYQSSRGNAPTLSIRTQLWLLFSYVIFLPLIGAMLLGWLFLKDREDQIRHSVFKECLDQLKGWEGGFPVARRYFLEDCRKVRQEIVRRNGDLSDADSWLSDLCDEMGLDGLYTQGRARQVPWHSLRPDQKGYIVPFRNLARVTIKKYIPEREDPKTMEKIDVMSLMADEMIRGDDMGWGSFAEFRDSLHEMRMGRSSTDIYWDVFPELATGPLFMATSKEGSAQMRKYYRARVASQTQENPVYFYDLRHQNILPTGNPEDLKVLTDVMTLSENQNMIFQEEVRTPRGILWVVTFNENKYNRFSLGTFRRAGPLLDELIPLKTFIFFVVIFSLFLAIVSARFLADLFLLPIRDLMGGIKAIRERLAGFVVPLRRDDEFGELAGIFNRMLANFRELELASIVQGQLFPKSLPEIPGYEIVAKNISATNLGGDYFDFLPMPSGNTGFLIGDATGHGTPAALVMAMAKASVAYHPNQGDFSPETILRSLNYVFSEELRSKRKFMTLVFGVLDHKTHEMELRNYSHNYPLFFHASKGTTQMPEMPGFPLGIRPKFMPEPFSFSFQPGDSVVFYTDGYTECQMKNGEMIMEDGMMAQVEKVAQKGAWSILSFLTDYLEEVRIPGPLQDDVTLLIIRRLP